MRPVGVILAGAIVGALATAGVLVLIVDLVRGDTPTHAGAAPSFIEETESAGLDQVYDGDFLYFVGGGVAVFDCNDDGKPDLYVAGGSRPAGLYLNQSRVGGAIRFTPITNPSTDVTQVTGVYPIDVDSDGTTDLAVLRKGENLMLRGIGECGFERANELWGVDGGNEWTTSFSATWEAGQMLPTLAFGNYLRLNDQGERAEGCEDHLLLRPEGSSYGPATRLTPGYCTLSILFSDWGRTGRSDLRMTNDRHYYTEGEEQLWVTSQAGDPRPFGREDGWQKLEIWGMGIASQDVTGDGLPEVFLTSQGDNKLQTLSSGAEMPAYTDVALARGATAHRPFAGDTTLPSTAWHAEFDDVNNDGFIDLFVTKGNVEAMPEFASDDPNNLLLGQPDGTFVESAHTAGLLDYARSRGAAVSDLNIDGMLDIVVVERREQVRLWRSAGAGSAEAPEAMGNWLALSLVQDPPNPDAIGAWIELRLGNEVISREVTIGGGHAGGELGWIHFGLGDADEATVRVIWPGDDAGEWTSVEANQFLIFDRQTGQAQPWAPVQD